MPARDGGVLCCGKLLPVEPSTFQGYWGSPLCCGPARDRRCKGGGPWQWCHQPRQRQCVPFWMGAEAPRRAQRRRHRHPRSQSRLRTRPRQTRQQPGRGSETWIAPPPRPWREWTGLPASRLRPPCSPPLLLRRCCCLLRAQPVEGGSRRHQRQQLPRPPSWGRMKRSAPAAGSGSRRPNRRLMPLPLAPPPRPLRWLCSDRTRPCGRAACR